MTSTEEKLLDIYKSEYERLKAEQLQRITFRDVQIPFSIFLAIAPILSTAFAKNNTFGYHLLLIIPLICVSLGWAYIANDEKITTIGDYVREDLNRHFCIALKKIDPQNQLSVKLDDLIFGWEKFHKKDKYKSERKVTQFFVNLLTFVVSGEAALIIFLILKGSSKVSTSASKLNSFLEGWSSIPIPMKLLVCSEAGLLFGLGWWIYVYSGFWENFSAILKKWREWLLRFLGTCFAKLLSFLRFLGTCFAKLLSFLRFLGTCFAKFLSFLRRKRN